jgi:hypothetical protein
MAQMGQAAQLNESISSLTSVWSIRTSSRSGNATAGEGACHQLPPDSFELEHRSSQTFVLAISSFKRQSRFGEVIEPLPLESKKHSA